MGWIFQTGATKRAKQVTGAGLIVTVAAIYGGMNRRNFIPSDLVDALAMPLAAVMGVCALFAIFLDKNPNVHYNHYGPLRRLSFVLVGTLFFSLMSWMAFYWGAPAFITQMWGDSSQVEVRVQKVFSKRTGRGCHHHIEISGPGLAGLAQPCVSKETWQQAKAGGLVRLQLSTSSLGVQIDEIEQK